MSSQLTLALASTVRHDGNGGVADDLADVAGLISWVRQHAPDLAGAAELADGADPAGAAELAGDGLGERSRQELVALRRAVRSLFARAVAPEPPSRADAAALLTPAAALDQLNEFAGRLPVRPVLRWPAGTVPTVTEETAPADPRVRLTAALARAAIDFLAGPDRDQLRACPAPRCVRYFIREHPRQQWCKPSCGNRARVARHYHRQRDDEPAQR